ncbi:MAG: transcriptional regulator, tetR family [Actinomycetia bacterium]|nr:transcriptional regulator, tetR family [Actinomycetes bacterium]
MPPDASATRSKLLDAAAKAFAEHGVANASLLDITRQAGQRNRGALHYHFGSRDGVLVGVLERHADFLAQREGELLEAARKTPDDDIAAVVGAIVRPAVELAESGWRGRCCLMIIADLTEADPHDLAPEVQEALARTGGFAVYDVLAERLPPMPEDVRDERLALMTNFILRAVSDRARLLGSRRKGRPQLDHDRFVDNLIAMIAAAVAAPPLT